MPSRDLGELHPIMEAKARALINLAARAKIDLLVHQTFRRREEQAALWALGRDAQGAVVDQSRIVTNAPPGTSAHEFRCAFDAVPAKNGVPLWDAPSKVWTQLYKFAERVGLDALGDPWGEYVSWDKGHFQLPGWKLHAAWALRTGPCEACRLSAEDEVRPG